MIKCAPVLICAATLLVACSNSKPNDDSLAATDLQAINALHQAYVEAWLSNDTSGVLNTLTNDAVLMPSGMRPIAGRAEIKSFWFPNDGSRTTITDFTTTLDEMNGSGDFAYIRGRSRLAFTYEKEGSKSALTNEGMFLTIVQRQADRTWRISRQMWGPLKQ